MSMIEQPVEIEVCMPRYVIERDFGFVGEEEMQEVAALSKATGIEQFPDISGSTAMSAATIRGRSRVFACTAHRAPIACASTRIAWAAMR